MSGLSDRVAEAMDNKRYDEAAEGLAQMNRLTCIDNIVVDRLLEGARNEVKTTDSDLTLLTSPTPRTRARSCAHVARTQLNAHRSSY